MWQLCVYFFKESPYYSPDNMIPGRVMSPALVYLSKIALIILGLLWFHTYFRIIYCHSQKNVMSNFIEITLNLQTALSVTAILIILILPIQEHGIIFPFLCIICNFLYQHFVVFSVQVFHLLGQVYSQLFFRHHFKWDFCLFSLLIFHCQCKEMQQISVQ